MAITIDGDSGVSGVNGSATTPALQGTDSNTGIVFGTDTVQIATGGSTRATVDSSGNLGVGTSSPAGKLTVASRFDLQNSDTTNDRTIFAFGSNNLEIETRNSTGIILKTNQSERARITSAGRLGIGTSGPSTRVQLDGTDNGTDNVFFLSAANLASGAGGKIAFGGNYDGTNRTSWADIKGSKENATSGQYGGYLSLSTRPNGGSNTERVRIESDGLFRAFAANSVIHAYSASGASGTKNLYWGGHSATNVSGSGATNTFVVRTNGNVGNTNNDYGSLSDVKLKENIVDATSQWEDIKGIRVRKYNFKQETGHETFTQLGVIAQEIETVSPGLVTESPDLDEQGNDLGTVTKSVSYSVLYMKAVKALQEAQTRIETLETQHADLLARVTALEAA